MDTANIAQRDVFGADVTYTPSGGLPVALKMTERQPKDWEPADPGVLAVRWARLADFPAGAPANGDAVQIGAMTYEVVDVNADGGGGVYLSLGQTR